MASKDYTSETNAWGHPLKWYEDSVESCRCFLKILDYTVKIKKYGLLPSGLMYGLLLYNYYYMDYY